MKRPIIIVALCLTLSITLVVILYALSDSITHERNNFTRLFPPHPVIMSKMADIKYNSYYLAGATSTHIYLGNSTAPLHLLVMSADLAKVESVSLSIENIKDYKLRSLRISVLPPHFFLMDGIMPGIFRGRIGEWKADRFMKNNTYFVDIEPINSSSFVIKNLSLETNEHVIRKIAEDSSNTVISSDLLEKQIDGIFCTDGMLHYNPDLNQIVYLYYYRNQFVVADTNLNVIYRANTIDTTTRAVLKPAEIASQDIHTLSSPAKFVNRRSCVYRDLLFINSPLLAKNEVAEEFDNSSVIDVYNLKDRTYRFSFYLEKYKGKKMKEFIIVDNKLIALYDHYVLIFKLNGNIFKDNSSI